MLWLAGGGAAAAAFTVWLLARRARQAGRAAAGRDHARAAGRVRKRMAAVAARGPRGTRRRLRAGRF